MVLKNGKKKTKNIILVVLLVVSVITAFALFIQDNNKRAVSISIKSLRDATVQSAARVKDVLKSAYNEINITASLYEELIEDEEVHTDDLKKLSDETSFDYIEFVDADGIKLDLDGNIFDVSQEDYYIDGMKGNSGAVVKIADDDEGENQVIFYMPLYFEGNIKGVLTGIYMESTIQDIMSTSFFGESARTFLCMPDGTIIAACNSGSTSDNILSDGNFNKELDEDVKKELSEALLAGEEYEFQYEGSAGTGNAYATPLGEGDWVIIQTYPSQVTGQFVTDANIAGIKLLVELIAIFAVCFIIAQVTSLLQKKKLVQENKEKSYVVTGLTEIFDAYIYVDFENDLYKYLGGNKPAMSGCPKQGSYDTVKNYIVDMAADGEERQHVEEIAEKKYIQENLVDTAYLRYEYKRSDGSGKWDSLHIICINRKKGIPTEVLIAYADATKVKESELRSYEALKEAYEAVESANRAKSDFLSSMSHDIRTPMNAIMGMTAIAAMNIDNSEKVKDCLSKITVSSEHLLGLINEVLDMSKIESGKIHFAEEEFNLSDVVESIVTMFLPQTQSKEQNFNVNSVNITHEEVIGDSMRLKQIIVNILGNAVKFTEKGGNISFNICEKPSGMQGLGCYVFTFEDNGIGMDESFKDKIFEPFSRAQDSRTGKIEGTGLGMSIVKNLVQMMNGDIQVESRLNKGSKFTVTVYLKLNGSRQEDVRGLQNLKVLVADDDSVACDNACVILKEIGMNADGVLSGQEAVDRVVAAHEEKNDYSAVILDWKMPEMNGVIAARAIRERVGEDIPIIILSAFDYSEIEQEARNAGVDAFISKPLFRSRLVYIMKSLIVGDDEEDTELDRLKSMNYSGKRVLVVEDNEINMEIAKELLTSRGIEVEAASNGQLAVEKVNEMPQGWYDLIFMDIQMPVMNGYEAAAKIRASEREDLREIPILAMSADVFMDDIKRAEEAGMNGHVAKPIEIENLLKALDKWL